MVTCKLLSLCAFCFPQHNGLELTRNAVKIYKGYVDANFDLFRRTKVPASSELQDVSVDEDGRQVSVLTGHSGHFDKETKCYTCCGGDASSSQSCLR
jgi:hypothetical protein